jgi:tRNA(Ile)-lysidine synthase
VTSLLDQVRQEILNRKLLRARERVLVAVSGGVDSMVLLHLLHLISEKQGWKLTVAHLNHHLRGRSSDADESLVRKVAKNLGLPMIAGHADVKAISRKKGISLEMAAREARHRFLAEAARQAKARSIALAHHADDQLELFFIRLLRGSGTEALTGMKPTSPSPFDPKLRLIRPLLEQPKSALLQYSKQNRILFREDASNQLLDIGRNRIRHELLPLIRQHYQPAVTENILRLMKILAAESEFVGEAAANWRRGTNSTGEPAKFRPTIRLRQNFEELPIAVQRRCLHSQLIEQNIAPEFELIERLRLHPQTPVNISGSSRVLRTAEGRIIPQAMASGEFEQDSRKLVFDFPIGKTHFAGLNVGWRIFAKKGLSGLKPAPGREYFDANRVGNLVILRHWRPGDRFQPIGMQSAVKLQDLFVNQKVPAEKRRKLALATSENGVIIWVEGLRISECFKLTSQTTHRLQWQWRRV